MTREELKEHCEKQMEVCEMWAISQGEKPYGKIYQEHRLVLDLLEQTEWIPVSERLPEEREWYLAVFKESDTGYQLIPRVADYIGNGENEWRIIDEDGLVQEYRSILECVAWMPLPEPYEAESENKE